MDTDRLADFIQVYASRSISRAAERLDTSQSLLSRRIQQLEHDLDVRLFDRNGRGVIPTEAANMLYVNAVDLMARFTAMRDDMRAMRRDYRGSVAIGVSLGLSTVLAAPIARYFGDRHPHVRLRLVEAGSTTLLRTMHEGRIDAAVIYGAADLKTLVVEPVGDAPCVVIGKAGGFPRIGTHRPIALDRVAELPLILPSPPSTIRDVVAAVLPGARVVIEMNGMDAIFAAVEQGLGYSIVPFSALVGRTGNQAIEMRRVADDQMTIATCVATGTSHAAAVPHRELGRVLRDLIVRSSADIGLPPAG